MVLNVVRTKSPLFLTENFPVGGILRKPKSQEVVVVRELPSLSADRHFYVVAGLRTKRQTTTSGKHLSVLGYKLHEVWVYDRVRRFLRGTSHTLDKALRNTYKALTKKGKVTLDRCPRYNLSSLGEKLVVLKGSNPLLHYRDLKMDGVYVAGLKVRCPYCQKAVRVRYNKVSKNFLTARHKMKLHRTR